MGAPTTGESGSPAEFGLSSGTAGRDVLPARLAEVTGEDPQQLVEVTDQGRMQSHLDSEVLEDRDARRGCDTAGSTADQVGVEIADRGVGVDVDCGEVGLELIQTGRMVSEPWTVDQILLNDHS